MAIYHSDGSAGWGFRIGNRGCRYLSFWPLRWQFGISDSEFFRRYYLGPFEYTTNSPLPSDYEG